MRKLVRKVSPTVIAIALTAVVVGGVFLSLGWRHTNQEIHKDQRSWCQMLADIKNPPQQPTSDYGIRIRNSARNQYERFGCHGS